MVTEGLIRSSGKNIPKTGYSGCCMLQAVFFLTLIIKLNKHTVIMSNNKTGRNPIFRFPDIFEDGSEEIENPGHA